jgi:hypothetical protein
MAGVGDRVQVPSKRVGQAPREGVVLGVSGGLLRIRWSTGEESTLMPSMGSLVVVGKTRSGGAKKAATKSASKASAATPKRASGKASKSGRASKRGR